MEVYVLMGLASMGYMLSRKATDKPAPSQAQQAGHRGERAAAELPARRRYQAAVTTTDVRSQEMMRAQDAERAAMFPSQTGAVDPRSRMWPGNALDQPMVTSQLAGVEFSADDFRHNNMQPFFGSRVRENAGAVDTGPLLERYSGSAGPGNSAPKREQSSMFRPSESVSDHVNGNAAYSDAVQARLTENAVFGDYRNNEAPFEAIRVGPGVGQGYGSAGAGGFQQNQDRDYVMAGLRNVDELRPGNKPKVQLEGRLVSGSMPIGRGLVGEQNKNRPATAFDVGERGFVATGAPVTKDIGRSTTTRQLRDPPTAFRVEGAGPAGVSAGQPLELAPGSASRMRDPKLSQEGLQPANVGRGGMGNTLAELQRPQAPGPNERTTSSRPNVEHFSNGQGQMDVLGAGPIGMPVPGATHRGDFQAGLRLSGMENTVDSARAFGNMMPQMPSRGPAYDPYDYRTRTTLKETQIHDTRLGPMASLGGAPEGDKWAIGDTTRRTVRAGMCDTYDDTSVRNTWSAGRSAAPGAPRADPRVQGLPPTGKEVLADGWHVGIAAPAASRPNGYAGPDTRSGAGGGVWDFEPKPTARNTQQDCEYFGGGGRPESTGYLSAHEAMNQTAQVKNNASDTFQYYGIAKSEIGSGIDYEHVYNSTLNETKEALLATRVPGGHAGPKAIPDTRLAGDVTARPALRQSGYTPPAQLGSERGLEGSVTFKTGLPEQERLDDELLSWLKTNPLVTSPIHRSSPYAGTVAV